MLCRELFEMGVRCFDIDIVITSDQQLLVAHPKALQVTSTLQSACVLFDHRLTALCCFLQSALTALMLFLAGCLAARHNVTAETTGHTQLQPAGLEACWGQFICISHCC